MEPVRRPGGPQTSQAPNQPRPPAPRLPSSILRRHLWEERAPGSAWRHRGLDCPWSMGPVPGPWALSIEGNPPVQRLGGVEEWRPGCRLLEAPTARPSRVMGGGLLDPLKPPEGQTLPQQVSGCPALLLGPSSLGQHPAPPPEHMWPSPSLPLDLPLWRLHAGPGSGVQGQVSDWASRSQAPLGV